MCPTGFKCADLALTFGQCAGLLSLPRRLKMCSIFDLSSQTFERTEAYKNVTFLIS